MPELSPLTTFDVSILETPRVLRKVASAGRRLAELKGMCSTIPNHNILISTLALQEAKDSSEIENIITTHDDLYRDSLFPEGVGGSPAAKEVHRYVQALRLGYQLVLESTLITSNHILSIQEILEENRAGFRKLPGTALKNNSGDTVYTPPQDPDLILSLMSDLERVINDDTAIDVDPLVKMAIIHFQFESIHPFYDGNGRTGRIINILYLVQQGLLDAPILYLSRYIVRTKGEYYRLLQEVRDSSAWVEWILYMLTGVEETSLETMNTVVKIKDAIMDYKHRIRSEFRFYSQDLINNLFNHPYTRIEFVERDLNVSRLTASRYLEALADASFLAKHKVGRSNFYVNTALYSILASAAEAII